MIPLFALWTFLRALLFGSAAIALENRALRHQLVSTLPEHGTPAVYNTMHVVESPTVGGVP